MSNPWAIGCLIPLLALRFAMRRLALLVPSEPSPGSVASIRRYPANRIDFEELLSSNQPAILEGVFEALETSVSADLSSLQRAATKTPQAFEVNIYDGKNPYFLYVGDYGKQLVGTRNMGFAEFLGAMFDEEAFEGQAVYQMFGQRGLDGFVGQLLESLASALSSRTTRLPEPQASGIWIGSRGVLTPLHYDAWPGLLFQAHGTKRLLMFSPEDISNLYFLPPYAVRDRWSKLPARSSDAAPEDFPLYRQATRLEGELRAGEALFVPPFWPHEIEALEPNISVPFRFKTNRSEQLSPNFLRPACEVFYNRFLKRYG
jgi:hypothetical protein